MKAQKTNIACACAFEYEWILKSIHCHANLDVFEMPLAGLRYHLAEELFITHLICGRMDIDFTCQ